MKRIILTIAFTSAILLSFKSLEKETYKAIADESVIEWSGSRPGKTHNGTLGISDGNFEFEESRLVGGDFTLNMKTIKVLDIPAGSKGNTKLVNHLKSSDFFDVENHPVGKFEITGSEIKEGKTFINGKLTLKGITNAISFPVTVSNEDGTVVLSSEEFKIDRTKWDVKFRSGSFFDGLKNKLIYDDITIATKIKAKKQVGK